MYILVVFSVTMKVKFFFFFWGIISVRAVDAILETGEKLEQWSKEPEPAISAYNLFGLIPEEDRLFYNTILLRLVDAFCSGDELVKLAVVRVFMSMFKLSRGKNKSECATWFLSKARVHNHLEILKRVKDVYEKGDTEAKALALILFGCLRDFASEFAPVRYLIFTSMVSSHDLEVNIDHLSSFFYSFAWNFPLQRLL